MAVENKNLEEMLTGEFDKAQERLQSSKTAIGIAKAPQHELFGFTPRAIRIKGQLIGAAELAELNRQSKFVMEDFIQASQIVDQNERNRANIELKKEMGGVRDKIVKAGLKLDQELARQKMSQDTTNLIINTLSKGLAAAGQAWAIRKLAPAPVDDKAVGRTMKLSSSEHRQPARYDKYGESLHGETYQDWLNRSQYKDYGGTPNIDIPGDFF